MGAGGRFGFESGLHQAMEAWASCFPLASITGLSLNTLRAYCENPREIMPSSRHSVRESGSYFYRHSNTPPQLSTTRIPHSRQAPAWPQASCGGD